MYTSKSFILRPAEAVKKWFIVDVAGRNLGRIATHIADVLRGKRNPRFTPHTDSGDFVIVTNAEKIQLTGNKWDQKKYYRHTGYSGGLKELTAKEQLSRNPEKIIMDAVKGMLPKNSLGRKQLTKLRVYRGSEHNHGAQSPVLLDL